MSSDFSGNPTAAESPSPAPAAGAVPIVRKPSDGDGLNAASVSQDFQTLADFGAWLCSPPYQAVKGPLPGLSDDFLGASISAANWVVGGSPAIVDDSANGGFGTVRFAPGASNDYNIATANIVIGTRDYAWAARFRLSGAPDGSQSRALMGIGPVAGGGTSFAEFDTISSVSATKWCFIYNGTNFVSAVDYTADTTHHTVAMARISGTMTGYIDGAQVFSAADTTNVTVNQFYARLLRATTGSAGVLNIDYMRLWIGR